ncbi:hypothetical protein TIFTF001_032088 [Ficus carica]|uniref:Uncharacterized protein n=1 Tax=Ficus carica TaxID=3494 RepID=A0AA88DW96_FICCA|nr:hypothetical protein TIFTF001_032088 [Ficus carica]
MNLWEGSLSKLDRGEGRLEFVTRGRDLVRIYRRAFSLSQTQIEGRGGLSSSLGGGDLVRISGAANPDCGGRLQREGGKEMASDFGIRSVWG